MPNACRRLVSDSGSGSGCRPPSPGVAARSSSRLKNWAPAMWPLSNARLPASGSPRVDRQSRYLTVSSRAVRASMMVVCNSGPDLTWIQCKRPDSGRMRAIRPLKLERVRKALHLSRWAGPTANSLSQLAAQGSFLPGQRSECRAKSPQTPPAQKVVGNTAGPRRHQEARSGGCHTELVG